MSSEESHQATLESSEPLNARVTRLTFSVTPAFACRAGPHVAFRLPGVDKYYSIASAPADALLEFAVGHDEDGFHQMAPGTSVALCGPSGDLGLADPNRDALLVAAGTGVAPMRAILRHVLGTSGARLTLLHGCRQDADRLFAAEFMEAVEQHRGFDYCPSLSRPDASWTGLSGYVQTHLAACMGRLKEPQVLVCGAPPMVGAVRSQLGNRGVPERDVVCECYG